MLVDSKLVSICIYKNKVLHWIIHKGWYAIKYNQTINSWPLTIPFFLIIFTNPSAWAGYNTRSIFKRSLTGLNSEFSFSETSCLTKAEEPSLPYYLPIAGGRIFWIHTFPKGISAMWNAISRRCPWSNGYRRRMWTRQHEFKSWTSLITFLIALIPLGKVWIQIFSLQLWVNSRAD